MQSIRVICLDSYQAAPIPDVDPTFSQFRGSDVKQVPILRIFGITLAGDKVCLHIHGVFPYMYVPYTGSDNPNILAYRLAESIDTAINVSLGSAKSNTQHVYRVQQISGIPFYGYHKKRHHFFKIYFYNPAMIKKATELFYNGSILDQTFQPHEAHIPYTIQFMIDYNVYGMSIINLKNVKYRYSGTVAENEGKSFHDSETTINLNVEEKQYMPFSVTKQSVCKIEIDAWASDIANRDVIDKGIDLNPGIAAIWEEEKARRANADLGGDSQMTYPSSPERTQAARIKTDNDVYHETRLAHRLCALESQMDESSASLSSENTPYPVPVPDDSNLPHASQVEIHAGPLDTTTAERSHIDNELIFAHSQATLSNLSLDNSDLEFAHLLANLNKEEENPPSQIDSNSILGSQLSQNNFSDFPLEQDQAEDEQEEEEEVPDLNMTNLELDTLDLSQWDNIREKSQPCVPDVDTSQIELVLESLKEDALSSSCNIPQVDGPVDDDDDSSDSQSNQIYDPAADVTVERREHVGCEYRGARGRRESLATTLTTTTPRKRSRQSSSSDDEVVGTSAKRPRTPRAARTPQKPRTPRTPRRTPNKRSSLTSPSCPGRTYSPLSVEITCGQRTPKTSPSTSPKEGAKSTSRLNSSRKRIFSPVKESPLEEKAATSSESDTAKPLSKTSEEMFVSEKDTPDSDVTLVEDTDDSLDTVMSSPPKNRVIIDESDSNDTTLSKNQTLSNLSAYNFPHESLQSVAEEEAPVDEIIRHKEDDIPLTTEGLKLTSILKAPTPEELMKMIEQYHKRDKDSIQPFFSNQEDADAMQRCPLPTGALFRAKGPMDQPDFLQIVKGVKDLNESRKAKVDGFYFPSPIPIGPDEIMIQPLFPPPSRESVEAWLEEKKEKEKKMSEELANKAAKKSEENAVTDSPFDLSAYRGFGFSCEPSKHLGVSCGQIEFSNRASMGNVAHENLGNAKALTNHQFMTIICLEVHVATRPNFLPDSRCDPIAAIFYAIHNDVPPDWTKAKPLECGAIIVDENKINVEPIKLSDAGVERPALTYVQSEEFIFDGLLAIIERCDPEILIGWDLETLSWGYVFQRASILGKNLSGKISRIPSAKCSWEATNDQATPDLHIETLAEVKLPGRIVLDVWRIMRYEIALTSYTYENVMYNVMNERIPHYSYDVLMNWWERPITQWRVIDHYANKVIGVHRLLHHLDIINRTSEHARLYGIQFFEVFSRGSQFRVESMMLRLAKPLNYIPVSPSAHQRGCMRAPECLPLIMEPESTMYSDPVVVLDFQSLYPSIIIAYNYCFSTCLGRVDHIGSANPFEFGATTLKVPKKLALKLQNKLNFAPCGVAFVKEEVRRGVLPQMLSEILETRLMVKKAIKDHPKEDRGLQRALHSRQLGLKLIANVTYGYTAANFSGRMPCIEVGDSVVSKGKETLERAIRIVESTPKWGARVIYGDTDSLFVLLKGKTRAEAFEIGAEIADTVTAANPKPVKLKFEKVMQPCILQTKKRYCGYMYENLNDKPVYLAKGIETVRRDGCPAVAKILEKSLRILFETKDLSEVKQYVTRQLDKILTGRASIQDLTFAKEFRGIKGYKAAACVPALELTKRLMQKDPCAIPRRGSRVPYIIVAGGPNVPLIRCVRSPDEVIQDPGLRPNAVYYITKVIIPPLNRCLNLIGVDAFVWYMEMPHRQALNRLQGAPFVNSNRKQKTTISQYLCNTTCPSCGESCDRGICANCIKNQTITLVVLYEKCRHYERICTNIKKMCESCIGVADADSCTSLDCPIYYRRMQAQRDSTQISHIYDLIQCMEHLN